jgi:hypothetical protein
VCALAYSAASRGYWYAQQSHPFAWDISWAGEEDFTAFLEFEMENDDMEDIDDRHV